MLISNKRKRLVSLLLVFSLAVLSGNSIAQAWKVEKVRTGAKLKIQKNDGQEVRGELITVKKDSLLLLSEELNADVSEQVLIKEVATITIVIKSRGYQFGVYGVLLGLLYGFTHRQEYTSGQEIFEDRSQNWWGTGAIGGVAGIALGNTFGINKRIQIQGKSDTEIQIALEKLSKKARVPGIQ